MLASLGGQKYQIRFPIGCVHLYTWNPYSRGFPWYLTLVNDEDRCTTMSKDVALSFGCSDSSVTANVFAAHIKALTNALQYGFGLKLDLLLDLVS